MVKIKNSFTYAEWFPIRTDKDDLWFVSFSNNEYAE